MKFHLRSMLFFSKCGNAQEKSKPTGNDQKAQCKLDWTVADGTLHCSIACNSMQFEWNHECNCYITDGFRLLSINKPPTFSTGLQKHENCELRMFNMTEETWRDQGSLSWSASNFSAELKNQKNTNDQVNATFPELWTKRKWIRQMM